VGTMTKSEVRHRAVRRGLRTAAKPDSQDVCFIHSAQGRDGFLSGRISLHEGVLVDEASEKAVGTVPAVELITPGQRRGLGVAGDGTRRYALSVDVVTRHVVVGDQKAATTTRVALAAPTWVGRALAHGQRALAQTSAHGQAALCTWEGSSLRFDEPQRLVAPGQTVAFYDAAEPDAVVGSAIAA
jgi:tRNA-uridine 2-sulfurtransferase